MIFILINRYRYYKTLFQNRQKAFHVIMRTADNIIIFQVYLHFKFKYILGVYNIVYSDNFILNNKKHKRNVILLFCH